VEVEPNHPIAKCRGIFHYSFQMKSSNEETLCHYSLGQRHYTKNIQIFSRPPFILDEDIFFFVFSSSSHPVRATKKTLCGFVTFD
jgi:hypothetical protein